MLKHDPDNTKGIEIEINLTDRERGVLNSFVKQECFDILQKIMIDQVKKFNLKLINTSPANQADVLSNHYLAKAVAQFYVGLMQKIEQECEIVEFNDASNKEPINDMNIDEFR